MGALDEGPSGSSFEVDCRERVYKASSSGQSLADAKAQVFWSPSSCLEARIRVSVAAPAEEAAPVQEFDPATSEMQAAPPPPVEEIPLTVIYAGPEGFRQLIADFSGGSHAYGVEDFKASYNAAQWAAIRARLAQARFRSARVFLQVELSDEMKRYLGASTARAELPTQILD